MSVNNSPVYYDKSESLSTSKCLILSSFMKNLGIVDEKIQVLKFLANLEIS
jgi:hypothetical protein